MMAMWREFRDWLQGWPNGVLSLALMLAGVVLWLIALHGTATEKAIAAAYVFLP